MTRLFTLKTIKKRYDLGMETITFVDILSQQRHTQP